MASMSHLSPVIFFGLICLLQTECAALNGHYTHAYSCKHKRPNHALTEQPVEPITGLRTTAEDFKPTKRIRLDPSVSIPLTIDEQIIRVKEYLKQKKQEYMIASLQAGDSIPHTLSEYTEIGHLGAGQFGKVYKAMHNPTQKLCAVKVINKTHLQNPWAVERILKEKDLMQGLDFPFVVKMQSAFMENENLFIVLDYEEHGDLEHVIDSGRDISEYTVKIWAAQVALALEYLHNVGIIHRDIKADNILLDENYNAKITDFGLSTKVSDEGGLAKVVGNPVYMAPELRETYLMQKAYTSAVDWYSYGILLFQLVGGHVYGHALLGNIVKKIEDLMPSFASGEKFASLIQRLTDSDPAQRLGSEDHPFEEIMRHPYFEDINWVDVLEQTVKPEFGGFFMDPKRKFTLKK